MAEVQAAQRVLEHMAGQLAGAMAVPAAVSATAAQQVVVAPAAMQVMAAMAAQAKVVTHWLLY